MERQEKLISKKELLERFGISYGALYRWKRKGLIPEEWFLRRSTSTGQETFFPAEKILPRVELILARKEDLLLDEIGQQLADSEKESGYLLLDTAFGLTKLKLSDIRCVTLRQGGRETDLTSLIRKKGE